MSVASSALPTPSQFFQPTTSSSPFSQQTYGDMPSYQQAQTTGNKYWSNAYHPYQHNYALAALAAANYHPQLAMSPLNHLGQSSGNYHSTAADMKAQQFTASSSTAAISPNSQFFGIEANNSNNSQGTKLQFN